MDVAERIGEANEKFKEAIRTADGDMMPSLYTRDAVILPPNADAVSGEEAITQYWESFFRLGITDARPVTREVIVMGDYAPEVGETTVYRDDGTLVDRGKIMVLCKNDGGTWKMHRDTWNSSVTPPQ